MNLSQMRTQVYLRMAETSGQTFTDAEVDVAIELEYEHLQTIINMEDDEYFSKESTTNTTGSDTFAFPLDFVKMLLLEILRPGSSDRWATIPKTSVTRKEEHRFRRSWLYDDPQFYYYVLGNNYIIVPAPEAGTNNLKITYVYEPPELTLDADVPLIPKSYHEILPIGAVNRLRKAVKEPPIDEPEYDKKIYNLVSTISPRVKKNPRQVRIVPGGPY